MWSMTDIKATRYPRKKKGLRLVGVRFDPKQVAALRAEALRRAAARGSGQVDVSEVVREAVALWLKQK